MLHILMGRARTGKSGRVLQRIAALGDSSQQILLVPEHASHVAEMDLCRVCGDTASRHAEALTFKLLASRVLGICGGSADVSFGSLSVDLQKCEHLGENCTVDLNCAFGELVLIVPGRFRVEPTKSAAFASVSVSGAPDDDAAEVIHVNCDASFGEISIHAGDRKSVV